MKKLISIFTATALAASLAACDGKTASGADSDKPQIYATFYTMYDFASKIAGDKADVYNLIPTGQEAHHWEPSTEDMKKLEKADMLVTNGAGFESWTDKLSDSISNDKLVIVDTSAGIELLPSSHSHDDEDEHDEEDHDEDEHDEEEEHHDEEEEHEHSHGAYDPHVWTSIKNAKIQMENIKNALVSADSDNKDYYEANYTKWAAELDKLDNEYADGLANVKDKTIVVSHQAFGYLCRDYGLNQVGISGITPDTEPDPARMVEIVDLVKEKGIKTIFFEELATTKVADAIAAETGASVSVLNPCEGLTQEQLDAGKDYISVMRENLESLKKALN